MIRLGFALMLAFTAAPAVPQTAPPPKHSGVLTGTQPEDLAQVVPPERYQQGRGAITIFDHQAVTELCSNKTAVACTKSYPDGAIVMVVPNPCPLAGKEIYATIVCHELGHANGWSKEHGD